jgi:hypothetical protein
MNTGGVWVTVKFIPLTVLIIEIRSKFVTLSRSEVKHGDVVVIYSRVNTEPNQAPFGMRPWIYSSVKIGPLISICLGLFGEMVLARVLCLQPAIP